MLHMLSHALAAVTTILRKELGIIVVGLPMSPFNPLFNLRNGLIRCILNLPSAMQDSDLVIFLLSTARFVLFQLQITSGRN